MYVFAFGELSLGLVHELSVYFVGGVIVLKFEGGHLKALIIVLVVAISQLLHLLYYYS